MARSYKHPNSKEIFHARRKARPDQERVIDLDALEFCQSCGVLLEEEEVIMGLCAQCDIEAEEWLEPDDFDFESEFDNEFTNDLDD